MINTYRTIRLPGRAEITEKKSSFIGQVIHAESAGEAEEFYLTVRRKYYDARHHCFAYITGEPGTPQEVRRMSDDGEPGGTAGHPMLEVLEGENLHHTAAIVTRYFGGTLLGTGGLVRAYTEAVKAALSAASVITVIRGKKMTVRCSYAASGKLMYLMASEKLPEPELIYKENVEMTILVPAPEAGRIRRLILQITDGQAVFLSETETEYSQKE